MENVFLNKYKSKIFRPGQKFIVLDNSVDTILRPGTMGTISYTIGPDSHHKNVVFIATIISRRGKNGKERIERKDISTPIYNLPGKKVAEFMPDKQRKQYVFIKKLPEDECNILDMPDTDFLIWAYSKTLFCEKLTSIVEPYTEPWLGKENNILYQILDIESIFNHDPISTKAYFCTLKQRKAFITLLRHVEFSLMRGYTWYQLNVHKIELNAINYLMDNWENTEFPFSLKDLQKIQKSLLLKSKNLSTLFKS